MSRGTMPRVQWPAGLDRHRRPVQHACARRTACLGSRESQYYLDPDGLNATQLRGRWRHQTLAIRHHRRAAQRQNGLALCHHPEPHPHHAYLGVYRNPGHHRVPELRLTGCAGRSFPSLPSSIKPFAAGWQIWLLNHSVGSSPHQQARAACHAESTPFSLAAASSKLSSSLSTSSSSGTGSCSCSSSSAFSAARATMSLPPCCAHVG